MDGQRQSLEALVGILILLGLFAIGLLIYKFGKLESKIQQNYNLTLEVSDATGIRTGVPVRLGGVAVGQVSGHPRLKPDYSALEVPLEIHIEVKIPQNSVILIGSSGLMGDNYIKINLPVNPSSEYLAPGAAIKAGAPVGLLALQSDAEGVLNNVNSSTAELSTLIQNLNRLFSKIEKVIDSEDSGNLSATIADLSEMAKAMNEASQRLDPLLNSADDTIKDFQVAATNLKETSGKLDPLVDSADHTLNEIKAVTSDARRVIHSAEGTLETGDKAIQDIATAVNKAEPTMEEIQQVLASFQKALDQVDQLVAATEESDGLIKALWDDPELKEDFKALVDKLETNGVIFYPRERDRDNRPSRPLFGRGQNSSRGGN